MIAAQAPADGRRIRLGALLTATMALSTVLQFAIGALGPALTADLGISQAGLGAIGATYYLSGGVLSRPLGRWIDRVGSRLALRATFLVAGLSLGAFAAIDAYPYVLLAMVPAGAAAAAGNPVTNRVIAGLSGLRGTLMAVKQCGVPLGSLAAGLVLPSLADAIGWRLTLLSLAVICVATTGATRWAPEPRRPDARRAPAGGRAPAGVKVIAAFAFCMGAGTSTMTTYLPLYGEDGLAMTATAAGALLAVLGICGIPSRILWTRRFERRVPAGGPTAILIGLAGTALVATAAVAAAADIGPWLLWVGVAVAGVSATAWNAVAMLMVVQRAPTGTTASASALVIMAFYFGMGAGAPAFGVVVDTGGGYDGGWAFTAACFVAACAAAVVLRRLDLREPQHATDAPAAHGAR